MKTNKNVPTLNTLENLATTIQNTNTYFLNKVQKQVNTALTLRNWIIGYTQQSTNNLVKIGQIMVNSSLKPSSKGS